MEYRKRFILQTVIIIILIACMVYMAIDKPSIIYQDSTETCKEDSLQKVIDQLQIDFENEQDGWDDKEQRYSQILFEYEYGLEHLKNYHPEAYKEFHRIVGYKEEFNHETERENKKRLNINKW